MLSQLLSSKPKTTLINLLLAHSSRSFSFSELKASSHCNNKLLKQTLKELQKMDFLTLTAKNKIKYYQINRHFALYPELINLLRKVKHTPEDLLVKQAMKISDCKLIIITGLFVGKPRTEADLLFVGKPRGKKLQNLLNLAEKFAEQEINYTILTPQEFEYRKIMSDRFVKNIMENNPVFAIDKTKQKKTIARLVYKF